jgi:cobalt-zinc-cadmium efflux system outer membrane protein
MKTTKEIVGAAFALAVAIGATSKAHGAPSCSEKITRATVVPCALEASLTSQSERLGLLAVDGRRQSAGVWLPANPTVSVTAGLPADPSATERTPLYSAVLSQELEIAGQRGARLGIAGAEQRAQQSRLVVAQRQAAADALIAYFDALAAAEYLEVATRLTPLATALREVGRARAEVGVGSNVDAALAEAVAIRLSKIQIAAQEQAATSSAILAALLGFNPATVRPAVEGELTPLDPPAPRELLVEEAIARRADLVVVTAERETQAGRVALFERLRVPNPTLSIYAKRDWIGERNIGIGLSFPIPLPSPVGRTYAGEIAEAEALARRAEVQSEHLRRTIRLEVTRAIEAVAARTRQVELYTPDQRKKSEAALAALAEELVAKRLPIREALIAQQGFIETLSGHVEAKRALCLASVELARVTGAPLERGFR